MGAHGGFKDLRLASDRFDAYFGDRALALTKREFQILAALVNKANHVVTSESLLEAMWGPTSVGTDHPVHVYISRVRRKMSEVGMDSTTIHTVRGIGYIYRSSPNTAQNVTLTYDRHLILRNIQPDAHEFLGWNPNEVVGTFFLLTSHSTLHSSRRASLAIARLWAAIGFETWRELVSVRCADGSARDVMVDFQLISRGRRFHGLIARIDL